MPRIHAIADVHNRNVPTFPADILIVAGDLTHRGTIPQLREFRKWLVAQPQTHKIIIAGNHDFCFQNYDKQEAESILGGDGIIYLMDQAATVMGLKIYGSPWQPWFYDWAFNVQRGKLAPIWEQIPQDLDILITHGPPFGYGDVASRDMGGREEHVGDKELLAELYRKKPRHLFYGHIHESTGTWDVQNMKFHNCSVGTATQHGILLDIQPNT